MTIKNHMYILYLFFFIKFSYRLIFGRSSLQFYLPLPGASVAPDTTQRCSPPNYSARTQHRRPEKGLAAIGQHHHQHQPHAGPRPSHRWSVATPGPSPARFLSPQSTSAQLALVISTASIPGSCESIPAPPRPKPYRAGLKILSRIF